MRVNVLSFCGKYNAMLINMGMEFLLLIIVDSVCVYVYMYDVCMDCAAVMRRCTG